MRKCLYCYKPLEEGSGDFHPQCAKRIFGTSQPPTLDYSREELDGLAAQIIAAQTSLTGVQPKLPLNLQRHEGCSRLTIVGLWGDYIFKPQTERYAQLPENEDLTMHLAEALKIQAVPHTLIRLSDNSLGYLTRRIDRTADGEKIDMEDMCQITLHLTEYKYRSSYEQIGKAIATYSSTPKLDMANFMQVLLFAFVTGNNDMHLKNFSLYRPRDRYCLTPAYDLLNSAIANPQDNEELALTLNGKKRKIRLNDFLKASETIGLPANVLLGLIRKMHTTMPRWRNIISNSFLCEELQQAYLETIEQRLEALK